MIFQSVGTGDTGDGSPGEKEKTEERTHIHKTESRKPAGGCPRQDGQKKGDDVMTEQELRLSLIHIYTAVRLLSL